METLDAILTAVGTTGFPIVFCFIMFWYMTKQNEQHQAEISELKDVITANTLAITELKQLVVDKYGN